MLVPKTKGILLAANAAPVNLLVTGELKRIEDVFLLGFIEFLGSTNCLNA